MKVPLRFQVTECDCGRTSLANAISYLFDREDIPVDLIRAIDTYTLDEYHGGTSQSAIEFLSEWITDYAKNNDMGLRCERYTKEEVDLDKMKKCINKKGVILVRIKQTHDHYAIVTDIDDEYVYMFDPYYFDETYYDEDKEVEIIFDQPFKYNRKIKIKRFLSEGNKDFALSKIEHRECVLMNRK